MTSRRDLHAGPVRVDPQELKDTRMSKALNLPGYAKASQGVFILRMLAERGAQDRKWGQQDHRQTKWAAILAEETGEVAQEALALEGMLEHGASEKDLDMVHKRLEAELVQVAAVCCAWREALLRSRQKWGGGS